MKSLASHIKCAMHLAAVASSLPSMPMAADSRVPLRRGLAPTRLFCFYEIVNKDTWTLDEFAAYVWTQATSDVFRASSENDWDTSNLKSRVVVDSADQEENDVYFPSSTDLPEEVLKIYTRYACRWYKGDCDANRDRDDNAREFLEFCDNRRRAKIPADLPLCMKGLSSSRRKRTAGELCTATVDTFPDAFSHLVEHYFESGLLSENLATEVAVEEEGAGLDETIDDELADQEGDGGIRGAGEEETDVAGGRSDEASQEGTESNTNDQLDEDIDANIERDDELVEGSDLDDYQGERTGSESIATQDSDPRYNEEVEGADKSQNVANSDQPDPGLQQERGQHADGIEEVKDLRAEDTDANVIDGQYSENTADHSLDEKQEGENWHGTEAEHVEHQNKESERGNNLQKYNSTGEERDVTIQSHAEQQHPVDDDPGEEDPLIDVTVQESTDENRGVENLQGTEVEHVEHQNKESGRGNNLQEYNSTEGIDVPIQSHAGQEGPMDDVPGEDDPLIDDSGQESTVSPIDEVVITPETTPASLDEIPQKSTPSPIQDVGIILETSPAPLDDGRQQSTSFAFDDVGDASETTPAIPGDTVNEPTLVPAGEVDIVFDTTPASAQLITETTVVPVDSAIVGIETTLTPFEGDFQEPTESTIDEIMSDIQEATESAIEGNMNGIKEATDNPTDENMGDFEATATTSPALPPTFNISDCATYRLEWTVDLAQTCNLDGLPGNLGDCQCPSAADRILSGELSCPSDGYTPCPEDCEICDVCVKLACQESIIVVDNSDSANASLPEVDSEPERADVLLESRTAPNAAKEEEFFQNKSWARTLVIILLVLVGLGFVSCMVLLLPCSSRCRKRRLAGKISPDDLEKNNKDEAVATAVECDDEPSSTNRSKLKVQTIEMPYPEVGNEFTSAASFGEKIEVVLARSFGEERRKSRSRFALHRNAGDGAC